MISCSLPDDAEVLLESAVEVLKLAEKRKFRIASAESCTGGLVSSLLTDIEGCSGAFECGFTAYSNEAKTDLLGVEEGLIARHGAVSDEVALAMVQGALSRSRADIAVAVTGFAGPAGSRDEEGLVYIAAARKSGRHMIRECHFGPQGREAVRHLAARAALEMLWELMEEA